MGWILKADQPGVCFCKPGQCAAPKPHWCISKRASEHPELLRAPNGLYVVRNGIAVAVTAEQMQAAAAETHAFCCIPGPAVFQKLIAALTRPADGADA